MGENPPQMATSRFSRCPCLARKTLPKRPRQQSSEITNIADFVKLFQFGRHCPYRDVPKDKMYADVRIFVTDRQG